MSVSEGGTYAAKSKGWSEASCCKSEVENSFESPRGTGYICRVIYGEFSDANSYFYLIFCASTAYNGTTENHGFPKVDSSVKGAIPESEMDIEASAKSTDHPRRV